MAAALATLLHLFLFLQLSSSDSGPPTMTETASMSEAEALLLFKLSLANVNALSSWAPGGSTPCDPQSRWSGVICLHGAVVGLRLTKKGLSGRINIVALTHLKGLRILSLSHNVFSGPIPDFGSLTALRAIYLSRNQFSGPILDDFFDGMTRLNRLWLEGNAFNGPIPSSLSKATNLRALHLEDNQFNGALPALVLPSLVSFNVSNNNLQGAIPETYSKFNESSFMGNPALCGKQLVNNACSTVDSPGAANYNTPAVVLILMALFTLAAVTFWYALCKKSRAKDFDTLGVEVKPVGTLPKNENEGVSHSKQEPGHRRTGSSTKPGAKAGEVEAGGGPGGLGTGDLVMVNDEKGAFGLPDLMKAAAEVMGSGGLGSAYKAVMTNGVAVVVKRMRDMNRVGKEEFEAEMRRLGKLSHRNVLPPLAYHYRKDEKLLVYEYIPKGSLLYVLHGDRGLDYAALDWTTRLKIARGIANGLIYLHTELSSAEVPHGNLKSGNVLLAPDFEPLLIDYGFVPLVNLPQASNGMLAFRAPEFVHDRSLSPKSDVYCLGVVLLELLTGKFPSQYLNNSKGGTDIIYWATSAIADGREEKILDPAIVSSAKSSVPEMKRLIGIALECVEPNLDRRLDVREAASRIEEVAAAEKKRAAAAGTGGAQGGHAAYVRGSSGVRSARRTTSIGERSARRNDDGFSFAIS